MEVLIINGNDYSRYVEGKGYGWTRNDLDTENTLRTKDGKLRRDKITTKRTVSFKMMNMTRTQLAQLDDDLSQPTFQASYLDLHGMQTREFYCSSFTATLTDIQDGRFETWEGASFTMIEV